MPCRRRRRATAPDAPGRPGAASAAQGLEHALRLRDETTRVGTGTEDLAAARGEDLSPGAPERRGQRPDGAPLGTEAGGEHRRRRLDEVEPEVVDGRAHRRTDDEPDAPELPPVAGGRVVVPGPVHD